MTQVQLDGTVNSLTANNFPTEVVENKQAALEKIKQLIPDGTSVMKGSSVTLTEIGFIDLLISGQHKWDNVHERVLTEKDPEKQALLRKQSVISDYYLGSAHAITETGEIVIASNTGSQLPHLVYTSQNIILVVGQQKIVPTLADAFTRIEQVVVPLEDKRMHEAYGFGTNYAKTLILHNEGKGSGRKFHVLIVREDLGY